MTLDGDTLTATDDFIIDAVGDITLDADGDEVIFKDGSTNVGHVSMDSDNLTIKSLVSDKDVIFQGNDGGSAITALTLDMSAAGEAQFNAGITSPGTVTSSGTLAVTGNLTVDGASGTSGQVLTSAGSGSTPTWTTQFVSGMIMLWSGSTGSIPSGWVICDGNNSTPDLRNRFVVGAGDTYSVDATGGSADATLASHTHTATSSVTDPGHFHLGPQGTEFPQYGSTGTANGGSGLRSGDPHGKTETKTTGISVSTSLSTAGSSATNANLPPYYALAYIMKT